VALSIFALLTSLGLFAGTSLAKRTEPGKLRRWFAIFLVVTVVYVLAKEISQLR